jgi:hypothetical protein
MSESRALPAIQMFWHGSPLSRIERLSMISFLSNGHDVHLYIYDEPRGVPAGVQLKDAADILPRSDLFFHRRNQSVAHFSDWFRYRLLFERGGLWSDTDMVCLEPFDYPSPIVFAWQDDHYLNNAVLGLPAGDPMAEWLARSCERPNQMLPYDNLRRRLAKLKRRVKGQGREWVRWGDTGPYGLTSAARHFRYIGHALPKWHFYPVAYEENRLLFESAPSGTRSIFDGSRAVHLWNQLIDGAEKNSKFPSDSPFEQLWTRYLDGATA